MKVVAVAHDPGGANAVAATVAVLREQGATVTAFARGPAVQQFRRLGVDCTEVGAAGHPRPWELLPGADLLLAGTSQQDRFEVEAIRWARKLAMPSVAVMDYWANYRLRFRVGAGDGEELVLPDRITALDPVCAQEMVADGLPANRIRITGQPYFGWLVRQQRLRERPSGPPRRVFFASQPEANEVAVLRALLEVLRGYEPLERLTVRFHPRQTERRPSLDLLEQSGLPYAVDESLDVLTTLQQQDLALGISSVILIEAALMGLPAGSLVMGVRDTLMTNRWGLTVPLQTAVELSRFIRVSGCVQEPAAVLAQRQRFLEQQRGADLRVAQLCWRLV